ncbi:uncharacterized protein L969DRAFT_48621, partial [Mixia osmundae IAM 14324]
AQAAYQRSASVTDVDRQRSTANTPRGLIAPQVSSIIKLSRVFTSAQDTEKKQQRAMNALNLVMIISPVFVLVALAAPIASPMCPRAVQGDECNTQPHCRYDFDQMLCIADR